MQKFAAAAKRADAAGYDRARGPRVLIATLLAQVPPRRSVTPATTSMAATLPAACTSRRLVVRVRQAWPENKPPSRASPAVDGGGGRDVDDTVAFAQDWKAIGASTAIDCSSWRSSPGAATARRG